MPSHNPPADESFEASSAALEPPTRLGWQRGSLPFWFAPLFFLLLASLFLWRSTFAGDVFLPANLLYHVAPWTSAAKPDSLPPWNPLRWDGIAQFYPWRNFAHETVRSGLLPLWNPYQFCGTPFVANSQSAVFYPPNALFYLLPTARAFGVSALLHLTLCGWFTYLFLRRLGCREASALLGGIIYAFSAWQVNWLQLPTFLATSCWFPLLLRQIYVLGGGKREKIKDKSESQSLADNANEVEQNKGGMAASSASLLSFPFYFLSFLSLPLTIGMMLLAGHLQIAFYGLLAGSLWGVGLLVVRAKENGVGFAWRYLGVLLAGLMLGMMLGLPQILPALELSRISHRASKPSSAGYAAYTELALPPADLAMLALPEFFGNDYESGNPYYGFYFKHSDAGQFALVHNAAETALYIGILPLMLSILTIVRQFTSFRVLAQKRYADRRVLFFACLALLALLLAFGTSFNALFYFLVPGFGQSGSPARCLVLWAFAVAILAAFGLDSLLTQPPTKREAGIVFGVFAFLFAIGLSAAAQTLGVNTPGFTDLKVPVLGEAFRRIGLGWLRLFALTVAGSLLLVFTVRLAGAQAKTTEPQPLPLNFSLVALCALALVIVDLFLTGLQVNPTAAISAVYPLTPGIKTLQAQAGHERIVPINKKWSQTAPPPVVLPPNAVMVYGLRDAQGYDSLLTGQYKAFANTLARPSANGSTDASPPQVGNMVFIQNPDAPNMPLLGAAFAVTLATTTPDFERKTVAPSGSAIYNESDDMAIYTLPNALPRAHLETSASGFASAGGQVIYQEDNPTRVVLRVNAPASARLVLADQFYPGWHAQLDGQDVPLQRSGPNGIFRAVGVPNGAHVVAFRYAPASFRIGLFLACLSGMLLSLLAGLHYCLFSRRVPIHNGVVKNITA